MNKVQTYIQSTIHNMYKYRVINNTRDRNKTQQLLRWALTLQMRQNALQNSSLSSLFLSYQNLLLLDDHNRIHDRINGSGSRR